MRRIRTEIEIQATAKHCNNITEVGRTQCAYLCLPYQEIQASCARYIGCPETEDVGFSEVWYRRLPECLAADLGVKE